MKKDYIGKAITMFVIIVMMLIFYKFICIPVKDKICGEADKVSVNVGDLLNNVKMPNIELPDTTFSIPDTKFSVPDIDVSVPDINNIDVNVPDLSNIKFDEKVGDLYEKYKNTKF